MFDELTRVCLKAGFSRVGRVLPGVVVLGLFGIALAIARPTPASADQLHGAGPLRTAIEDLLASFPTRYPKGREYLNRLDDLEKRAVDREDVQAELDALRREALVGNPLVSSHPIVFVVRKQYARNFEDPWPLSGKHFLCSRMTGEGEQVGMFLVDVFGNEVLLHTESPGCFDPMPLAPRSRPPVLPAQMEWSQSTGTFYVADVYRGTGMGRVPRGMIKAIRVVEAPPKRHWTRPGYHWHVDTHQAPAMNFNCTNNKRILGDAPVEPDGSAYFKVPADRFVFFQLLDAQGRMVQSMRSGTTLQRGEQAGCVGCHESRRSSLPIDAPSQAMRRPPSPLKSWYGPPREFNYLSEVQPVWDKYCVECHDYGKEAGDVLNLAGDLGLAFNTSYLDLRIRSPVRWHADAPGEAKALVKAVDDGPPQVLPPYAWGSHRSRLADVILGEHYDVKDKPDEPPTAKLVSPVAIHSASGPAFPQAATNDRPPDPRYVAGQTIDGDVNTFCCLLDDTLGGDLDTTIPAGGCDPVTGHIIFDLGRPLPLRGVRLIARHSGGPYNPREVEFFRLPDAATADDRQAALLIERHTYGPLREGTSADVYWDEVTTRYVGLRVCGSYESGGPVHYNFQIAEMQFFIDPRAEVPPDTLVGWTQHQTLVKEVGRLRASVEDLLLSLSDGYPGQTFLARLTEIEKEMAGPFAPDDAGLRKRFDTLRREALIEANPLVPEKLLFVKRFTYSPGFYYAEFMRANRFGGNLCVLDVGRNEVTELAPELAGGIFDRCDLSFDGRRVVFGYKAALGKGFRIWEVGVDGSGLRQLTFDPPDEQQRITKYWHPRNKPSGVYRHHTDDFHPCYLPDGGICFASTRCEQGVLCDQGDSLSVNVLYRIDADGGNLRRLSQGALSESTPSVANDGRILYTRWEYVDKGVIAVQGLWTMRPDGSGSTEVYGNEIEFPPVLIHGRPVPGSNQQFVATATMHHPFAVGPILLVDTRRDIRTDGPLRSLTPDTSLSIEGVGSFPTGEKFIHRKNGRWVADNVGPLYSEPYPLADPTTGAGAGKFFLVDCNPDKAWNDATAYGLYLIDHFGNQVKIYDDTKISCWQPIPLAPRVRPPVLPPVRPLDSASQDEAVVMMSDVYRGLESIKPGTVKYLRVWEQVPRPWSARRFWPSDETHGQHAVISLNAHIFVKIHHGVVPVREDGSAHFVVPARKNLFFQALDEDFMEVQRMRSFVNFQPGEARSCIGCHEPKSTAPPPPRKTPLALLHPPDRLAPQPGETVPRPIHYVTDVQPMLDKHCVGCHNPQQPEGQLDLSGGLTTFFNRSYEAIMTKKLVTCIQEFKGPQPRAQKTNVVTLPPYALGSHASRLIAVIREGHYECRLSPQEQIRLTTWVDSNAPYYGSYFGRRNLSYRDHVDFRPVPTLQSAAGVGP